MFRRIRTQSIRERRKKKLANNILLGLAFVGALILLVSQISMISSMRIAFVSITGAEHISHVQIEKITQRQLNGYWLGLFLKKSILFYPSGAIENEIMENLLRIKSVDVDLTGAKSIDIKIEEKMPVGVWCKTSKSKECYLLDENSFIFAKSGVGDKGEIIFIGDLGKKNTSGNILGSYFMSSGDFSKVLTFTNKTRVIGFNVSAVNIASKDEYDFIRSDGVRIIYSPKDNIDKVIENLAVVLSSVGEEELEYIDTRFENKIFYK